MRSGGAGYAAKRLAVHGPARLDDFVNHYDLGFDPALVF